MRNCWLIPLAFLPACSEPAKHDQRSAIDTTTLAPVRTAEGGVEIRSILAMDPRTVAQALQPFAANVPRTDPQLLSDLRGCGIRLVALPAREALAVEATLLPRDRLASRASRWLENGPLWAEAARESGSAEQRVVALHDSRLLLRPGYLRLLVRAWIEPAVRQSAAGARTGAAACVELAPQVIDAGNDDPWARALRTPVAKGLEAQGQVLTRLRARLMLQPDEALAIVFEAPGVEWSALSHDSPAAPAPVHEPESQSTPKLGQVTRDRPAEGEPSGHSTQTGPTVAGPAAFHTPTLGELLLGTGASGFPEGGGRVVLLLIPRMRDEVWLLGREARPPSRTP